MLFFAYKKLAQFAVRGALPPRRSESPVCATDNKPSCALHLLGWFIGSRGFSSLEQRPEFWVLQRNFLKIEQLINISYILILHLYPPVPVTVSIYTFVYLAYVYAPYPFPETVPGTMITKTE